MAIKKSFGVVNVDLLNVRKYSSLNSGIAGVIKKGTKDFIDYTFVNNDFFKIQVVNEDKTTLSGYCLKKFVTEHKVENSDGGNDTSK